MVVYPVEFHKGSYFILTIIELAKQAKGDHMFTVGEGGIRVTSLDY